ncbi:MAG: ornithine--oxo-acid transaminase [Propionicimonas sp.]
MTLNETAEKITLAELYSAHNYHPLPVVLTSGEGAWVTDVDGRRYLDALAGYSALNFGHRHPRLVAAATDQLGRLTLTSRAFHSERFSVFARDLAQLTGKDKILPMNSGAEAVETAIKLARRWGDQVRGVANPEIIVMAGNFHGRTTTVISFSDDPVAHDHYGPYTPGFVRVPYGDLAAARAAVTERTVAVLLEPIQGEGGVILPPDGYLRGIRELCTERGLLMLADEIQSGLARTGRTFACDHEDVVPDVYILGKALGGGIVPLSAVAADDHVMDVITPGSHGSTFGGNPFACAIGSEVIAMLNEGEFQQRAAELGAQLNARLTELPGLIAVRSRGLWAGIDIDPTLMDGRTLCERLLRAGVLAKDTHGATIRLAPPLVITADEVDWLADVLAECLAA